MLSTQDILLVLAIVAVLYGGKKLPEIGKGIGEAIRNFKKGISEQDHIDVAAPKEEPPKPAEEQKKDEKKPA